MTALGRGTAAPATFLAASARMASKRGVKVWLERVVDQLLHWQERAETRRKLLAFDDRMLSDIGISRADIDNETRKPFWMA